MSNADFTNLMDLLKRILSELESIDGRLYEIVEAGAASPEGPDCSGIVEGSS